MQTRKGNLLDIKRGIIVQGCNCQGKMGKGVAQSIRDAYPSIYRAYTAFHEKGRLKLGTTQNCVSVLDGQTPWAKLHKDALCSDLPEGLVIVNAMTQNFYGKDGKLYADYDAITSAFARIRMLARDSGLPVYFPLIGCGLAGGEWAEVAPRIDTALGDIEGTLIEYAG